MEKLFYRTRLSRLNHKRLTFEEIKEWLFKIFECDTIMNNVEDLIKDEDNRIDFSSKYDGSIWYLKTNKENIFYITETCLD